MTQGYIEAQCVVPSGVTASVTTPDGGPIAVSFTSGTYYMLDLVAHVESQLNASGVSNGGTWAVEASQSDDFHVTISIDNEDPFSITWTTSELGTLLGHSTITLQASVTGATAMHGIWIPDRPLNCQADPRIAPIKTNNRGTEGPTGTMFGFSGSYKYVHTGFRWAHVDRARVWDTDSGVTPSWERFVKDAQLGIGHSWFAPYSQIRIVDQTGDYVGNTSGITGWKMRGIDSVDPKKMDEAWTGRWLVEIPALVAVGG